MFKKTPGQKRWMVAFLGVTVLGILLELVAAFDPTMETIPWTDLIVEYVPWEISAAVFGALALWLPLHFGYRYYLKGKGVDWRAAARKRRDRER